MSKHEEVLNFIKRFQNEGTIKTFTQGCCYWFAVILEQRFNQDEMEPNIYYNPILNHFATWIDFHLYDITGEIEYNMDEWYNWFYYSGKDELETENIYKYCIDF